MCEKLSDRKETVGHKAVLKVAAEAGKETHWNVHLKALPHEK
jgi:hypothetical protein